MRQNLAEEIKSVKNGGENEKTFSARGFSIQVNGLLFLDFDCKFSLSYDNANGKSLAFVYKRTSREFSEIEVSMSKAGSTDFKATVSAFSRISSEDLFKELGQSQFFDNMTKFVSNLEEREQEIISVEKSRKNAKSNAKKARRDALLSSAIDNALIDL